MEKVLPSRFLNPTICFLQEVDRMKKKKHTWTQKKNILAFKIRVHVIVASGKDAGFP